MLDRSALAARGRRLEYVTICWNCLEGIIAIIAGLLAGSVSLVGFGVDSAIEVASGSAVLWRMSRDSNTAARERAEKTALRFVGACFLALALYVAVEAVHALISRSAPDRSIPGIAIACASLIVMPILSRAKRTVGTALQSGAMEADATQTELCAYLSAILLAGLLLNAVWQLWWADSVAALIMVPIIVNEGVKALRHDPCRCY